MLSRRGLFGVLAGAPAAAVGMVALPAKGEAADIEPLVINVDCLGVVSRDLAYLRAKAETSSEALLRRGPNGKLGSIIRFNPPLGEGDWRP